MSHRFTRRVVKKMPLQQDPMPEWDPEPEWDSEPEESSFRCTRSKTKVMEAAGGGGGGGSAAGAGGQGEAPYRYLAVTKFRKYVPPTPEMLLNQELCSIKAELKEASARASESFMAACTARNGNDYNKYMDRHAVHQAEYIRLYNMMDDLEWRIMVLELA